MGTKVVKPVLLKNVQIEGENTTFFCYFVLLTYFIFPHLSSLVCVLTSQELPIRPSVSRVKQGRTVGPQAPRLVKPALGTRSLDTERAPAAPVILSLSTQVGTQRTVTQKLVRRLHDSLSVFHQYS